MTDRNTQSPKADSSTSSPRTPIYEEMTTKHDNDRVGVLKSQTSATSLGSDSAGNSKITGHSSQTQLDQIGTQHPYHQQAQQKQQQPQQRTASAASSTKSMRTFTGTVNSREQVRLQHIQQARQMLSGRGGDSPGSGGSMVTPVSPDMPASVSQPQLEYVKNTSPSGSDAMPNSPQSAKARMYGVEGVGAGNSEGLVSRSVEGEKGQWLQRQSSFGSTHSLHGTRSPDLSVGAGSSTHHTPTLLGAEPPKLTTDISTAERQVTLAHPSGSKKYQRTQGGEKHLLDEPSASVAASSSLTSPPESSSGHKASRINYGELEPFAEGESGMVYKTTNKKNNRQVAIKVIPKTAKARYRKLRTELKILRRVRSHHVVRFYEYLAVDDSVWIVYEYMGGGSLADLLEGYPTLRIPEP
ncbi:hypothetical protein EC988_006377, partial [Linderina pennispora]